MIPKMFANGECWMNPQTFVDFDVEQCHCGRWSRVHYNKSAGILTIKCRCGNRIDWVIERVKLSKSLFRIAQLWNKLIKES